MKMSKEEHREGKEKKEQIKRNGERRNIRNV
jgi:hypothetical protein